MLHPVMRTVRLTVAVILVAASLVTLRAATQFQNPIQAAKDAYNKAKQQQQQGQPGSQAAAQPAPAQPQTVPNTTGATSPGQVPSAPPSGLDPSKLPDVLGIHLGMSPQDALAKMKPLYPENHALGLGAVPGYVKFGHAPDSPWIQTISAKAEACGNDACGDTIFIIFNGPPEKQGAVGIERGIGFPEGQRPTPDAVKAALLQKYGSNPFVVAPNVMGWVYDEQGQPIAPPNGKSLVQCAGNISTAPAGGPSPTNAAPEYGLTGIYPLKPSDVTQMMRDPCRVGVYVLANLNAAGQVVNSFDVKMSENSASTRAAISEQQYLDTVAAGQQQQQLNKAQKQAVPKF